MIPWHYKRIDETHDLITLEDNHVATVSGTEHDARMIADAPAMYAFVKESKPLMAVLAETFRKEFQEDGEDELTWKGTKAMLTRAGNIIRRVEAGPTMTQVTVEKGEG